MVHLVGLGDCDPMFLVFDLARVQLSGEGCDIRVRRVTPWSEEVCLDGDLLFGRDEVPRLELLDHRLDGMIIVTDVALFQIFDVLRVDGRNDGFD